MSTRRILLALSLPACLLAGRAAAEEPKHLMPVPFPQVHIDDSFWNSRLRANQTATIEANLRQCEITGRLKNFAIAAHLAEGKHQGFLFNDSDVYKVIEGIAYSLTVKRDAALEKRVDVIIDEIAASQQPDGYLNTYFTLVKPEERWKNLAHSHELYCAGHLVEAGVAYFQATGKDKLLNVAKKFADHIVSVFGPGKRIETSGHEEIELALIKLFHLTKEQKYFDQAKFFLEVRGRADQRKLFGEYAQDHKPIREQKEATGHAVRAMYLYCAIVDLAAITGDKELIANLEIIWKDVTERRMYITGGIGSSASNEGFTAPYDLPNDSAYCETCAAVGMALWNHRMFLMSGDGKYADVLEREVYNGLLSGVSLSGDRFYYTNPLASNGKNQRAVWFDCACCPTNVVRYVPGIGERMYATRGNELYAVLYGSSTADITLNNAKLKIKQETIYPWEEAIHFRPEPETPTSFGVNLRIPGWCKAFTLLVNGDKVTAESKDGFIRIERQWKKGDVVELKLAMPVQRVHADPNVKADEGRVALQRGPVVYCLEGIDNNGSVRNLVLPPESKFTTSSEKDTLGGIVVICGQAQSVSRDKDEKLATKPVAFMAIPYCTWANRGPGQMVVWIPEKPELAELPGEDSAVTVRGVQIRASHLNSTDTLAELNDGKLPKSSKDHDIRRMTWWDHRGSIEWVSYRLPTEKKCSACSVYWFDDTGIGACRVPAQWQLLYHDGKGWKPVKPAGESKYSTALDRFNRIEFEPASAREWKLEVKLQPKFSGGVLKWKME
jgi:uncharacterized protein